MDHRVFPQQASSVLAFHGKNVPTITIASYLMRIHKYCPTTYEIFLSLLVYFDRMTAMVNNGSVSTLQDQEPTRLTRPTRDSRTESQDSTVTITPDTHMSTTPPSDSSDTPDDSSTDSPPSMRPMSGSNFNDISQAFVVDSFNIHRLVMAGVTCSSKFFSDVFYTNSRYAKVSPFTTPTVYYEAPLTAPRSEGYLSLNSTTLNSNSFTSTTSKCASH